MAIVRIVAVSDTFKRAPNYLTPNFDVKTKKYLTGQDINWKDGQEDGRKVLVFATDEDEAKAKKLPLVIDPNESYSVRHNMEFNTDISADKILLEFFMAHKSIIADKKSNIISGTHRFYILDSNEEAKETVSKAEAEYSAMTEIKKMSLEDMTNFARVLGIGKVGGLSKTQIEAALFEKAKSQPAYVMSLIKDPDQKVKAFLKHLIEKNIVRLFSGKYMYNQEILGTNEGAVIEYLREPKNTNIVNEFSRLLKGEAKPVEA